MGVKFVSGSGEPAGRGRRQQGPVDLREARAGRRAGRSCCGACWPWAARRGWWPAPTAADELRATAEAATQVEAVADLRLEIQDPEGPVPVNQETTYDAARPQPRHEGGRERGSRGLFLQRHRADLRRRTSAPAQPGAGRFQPHPLVGAGRRNGAEGTAAGRDSRATTSSAPRSTASRWGRGWCGKRPRTSTRISRSPSRRSDRATRPAPPRRPARRCGRPTAAQSPPELLPVGPSGIPPPPAR